MTLIELRTQDNKVIKADQRIIEFSELFRTLYDNFEIEVGKPLIGIKEPDVKLLIEFCEVCDYTPIKFEKPIWKKSFKYHYSSIISKNKKLEEFYDKLDYNKMCLLFKLSFFYDSTPLKELLFFKLYEIFEDESKCKDFFKEEDKNAMEEALAIDDGKKQFLYTNYQNFVQKQMEFLTPEEIDDLCLKYYP